MEQVIYFSRQETKEVNLAVTKEITKMFFKSIWKAGLIGVVAYNILLATQAFDSNRITPIKINQPKEPIEVTQTKEALALLNCPKEKTEHMSKAAVVGAMVLKEYDIKPAFLVVLSKTEADFKLTARSGMGYKSIMQTPTSTGYYASDMVHGCDKLAEKLKISKGNLLVALTYYKGSKTTHDARGRETKGYQQAKEVIALYEKIKPQLSKG
jgi:hypothetical protein